MQYKIFCFPWILPGDFFWPIFLDQKSAFTWVKALPDYVYDDVHNAFMTYSLHTVRWILTLIPKAVWNGSTQGDDHDRTGGACWLWLYLGWNYFTALAPEVVSGGGKWSHWGGAALGIPAIPCSQWEDGCVTSICIQMNRRDCPGSNVGLWSLPVMTIPVTLPWRTLVILRKRDDDVQPIFEGAMRHPKNE